MFMYIVTKESSEARSATENREFVYSPVIRHEETSEDESNLDGLRVIR
jgi:hypothetical protein